MKELKGQERKKELINSLMIIDDTSTVEELSELDIDSLTELYQFSLKESSEQDNELSEDLSKHNDKPKKKFDFISEEEFTLFQENKEEKTQEQSDTKPNVKKAQRIDRLYKSVKRIEKLEGKKFNLTIEDMNQLSFDEVEELEEYLILQKSQSEENNKTKFEEQKEIKSKKEFIQSILKLEDSLINKSGDEKQKRLQLEELDKKSMEELSEVMQGLKDREFEDDRKNQKKKMRNSKEKLIQSIISNHSKLKELGINVNLKNASEDLFTRRRLEEMPLGKLERFDERLKNKISSENKRGKEVKNKEKRQEKLLLIQKLKKQIFLKGGKYDKQIVANLEKKDNQELDVVISKLEKIHNELPKVSATEERGKKLMKKGLTDLKGVGKTMTNELKQGMSSISSEFDQFENSMN